MLLSQGSIGIFWSNPLVGSLTTLALVMLVWPLVGRAKAMLGGGGGTGGRRPVGVGEGR